MIIALRGMKLIIPPQLQFVADRLESIQDQALPILMLTLLRTG